MGNKIFRGMDDHDATQVPGEEISVEMVQPALSLANADGCSQYKQKPTAMTDLAAEVDGEGSAEPSDAETDATTAQKSAQESRKSTPQSANRNKSRPYLLEERDFLMAAVKDAFIKKQQYLTPADFKPIAAAMHRRFAPRVVKPGDLLNVAKET
ncbi:uncharacterized protein PAC_07532 [Phialocephala subalpina]|uniref:Uncharacterized protein n=1 Tax=Phialocephala subalpina TaxID=576137 RepID=A0A1L7WY01_9HELO|nr:uncharacterized protein PAC_07532 [Phialocephala subalpina]